MPFIHIWIDIISITIRSDIQEKDSGKLNKYNFINSKRLSEEKRRKKGLKQINWIISQLGIQNEHRFNKGEKNLAGKMVLAVEFKPTFLIYYYISFFYLYILSFFLHILLGL